MPNGRGSWKNGKKNIRGYLPLRISREREIQFAVDECGTFGAPGIDAPNRASQT